MSNYLVKIADNDTVVSLANSLLELTDRSMFYNNKKPIVMTRAQARDEIEKLSSSVELEPHKKLVDWENVFKGNVTSKGNVVWLPVIQRARQLLQQHGVIDTKLLPVCNLSVWLVFRNTERQEEFLIAVATKANSVPEIDIEKAMRELRSKFKGAELLKEDFAIKIYSEYSVDNSKKLYVANPATISFIKDSINEFQAYPFKTETEDSQNTPVNHFIFDRAMNRLTLVSKTAYAVSPEVYAGMLKLWARANEGLLFANSDCRYASFVISWARTCHKAPRSAVSLNDEYGYSLCPLVVNVATFDTADNPISVYNQNRLEFLPRQGREVVFFKTL